MGLASLTDRVLPHLLATTNQAAFEATVRRTLAVDRPPPLQRANRVASTFDALRSVPTRNFFAPSSKKRLVVYLTDGESRVFSPRRMRAPSAPASTGLAVVHVWKEGERVFRSGGAPDPLYQADPSSDESVRALAGSVGGGRAFDEDELGATVRLRARVHGRGRSQAARREQHAYEPRAVHLPRRRSCRSASCSGGGTSSRRRRAPRRPAQRPRQPPGRGSPAPSGTAWPAPR